MHYCIFWEALGWLVTTSISVLKNLHHFLLSAFLVSFVFICCPYNYVFTAVFTSLSLLVSSMETQPSQLRIPQSRESRNLFVARVCFWIMKKKNDAAQTSESQLYQTILGVLHDCLERYDLGIPHAAAGSRLVSSFFSRIHTRFTYHCIK